MTLDLNFNSAWIAIDTGTFQGLESLYELFLDKNAGLQDMTPFHTHPEYTSIFCGSEGRNLWRDRTPNLWRNSGSNYSCQTIEPTSRDVTCHHRITSR